MGHEDVHDLRGLDEALGSSYLVLEMPDGDIVALRLISITLLGQEVITLFLTLKLGGKLLHRHPLVAV